MASKRRKRASSGSASAGDLGKVGQSLANLGYDPGDARGSTRELAPHGTAIPTIDEPAQDLHPGPVGRGPLLLATPGRVYGNPPRAGGGRELLGGSRLADAGLSGQENDPPAPRLCVFESGVELCEDTTSAHEVGRLLRAG